MSAKPYSQACENNKQPILAILRQVYQPAQTVWEIGSGTGQHACYFAEHLPHIHWQATDRAVNLDGIRLWQAEAGLNNLLPPLALDVTDPVWPCNSIDALFSANTLHIMSLAEVAIMFARLAEYLNDQALICLYGPFNYQGQYTSPSNANFDVWLKNQNPVSGIKHQEDILALAGAAGCRLEADYAMPANNRLLVLKKSV
ncbi:DUF938 domain-containing protein [Methylomonas paludis]|uniref:DUF938 domain-containing protein n=1 Tax=Methylomonas paludis TaxID=1173101 RepID=A0A975RB80_9GAMM|nr:DUF938 domain-containing protein [Methylomonas paludis]QWF72006.1 DUF938 domain-containing protein [Methylomonas paludis]